MSAAPDATLNNVTLEDLAALNHEMAALVRAGLPLEAGLRQAARDFDRPTSKLAAALEREMSAGKSLTEAIEAHGDALPAIYRATVAAGLQSGRLAAALEGLANAAVRTGNLRRITLQASVYPLLVVSCTWFFLLFVAVKIHPAFEQMEQEPFALTQWLRLSNRALGVGVLIVPAALLLLTALWWLRSGGARSAAANSIPGIRKSRRLSGQANFAELLAALLEARVPLDEALPLAAYASGLPAIQGAAQQLAAHAASGRSLTSDLDAVRQLPPLVRLALLSGGSHETITAALRRAAATYSERAEAWVRQMAFVLPIAATLGIGGTVVVGYAIISLAPYFSLLYELSQN